MQQKKAGNFQQSMDSAWSRVYDNYRKRIEKINYTTNTVGTNDGMR